MRSSFCNAHAGNDMEHHGRESREQKEEERDHELELARRYEGELSGLALPAFAGFVAIHCMFSKVAQLYRQKKT